MPIKSYISIGLGVIVGLFLLTTFFGSWYTIDAASRGILLRNGAFEAVIEPGLHVKFPWIDTVHTVDMQTHTLTAKDMEAYSADQQPAKLKFSVTYHVNPEKVAEMYTRFGGDREAAVSRIITPLVQKDVKIVFGQYSAQSAITQRGKLNSDTAAALTEGLIRDPTFVIESTQLEDIAFSPDYIHSVEERMRAEVAVTTARQTLEKEKVDATIRVTKAQGEADSVLAIATANAKAIVLQGNAQAEAIEARAKALGNNPLLVDLTQAERWNGTLPSTMLPNSSIPMIQLKGATP